MNVDIDVEKFRLHPCEHGGFRELCRRCPCRHGKARELCPECGAGFPEYIVAEVSKNWRVGEIEPGLLSTQFEGVISRNLERGYLLHSWALNQVMTSRDELVETIIAVFQKK